MRLCCKALHLYNLPENRREILVGPCQPYLDPLPFEQIVPSDYLTFREPRAFTPFYLGRHYLGVFASLPSPGSRSRPWSPTCPPPSP